MYLSEESSLYCFGYSKHGQLGVSPSPLPTLPTLIHTNQSSPLSRLFCGPTSTFLITKSQLTYKLTPKGAEIDPVWSTYLLQKIASMSHVDLALTAGGDVLMGGGADGLHIPIKLSTSPLSIKFVDIAAGSNHSLLLSDEGDLYGFGDNDCGQLGLPKDVTVVKDKPHLIPHFKERQHNIVSIACGAKHSLVLTKSGKVWSFGSNKYGQLGLSGYVDRYYPTQIHSFESVTQIACGENHSLMVHLRKLYTFGSNKNGQLGHGDYTTRQTPTIVKSLEECDILKIAAGGGFDCSHSLVLVAVGLGVVYSFGSGSSGQLGYIREDGDNPLVPRRIDAFDKKVIKDISCGALHTAVLVESQAPLPPEQTSSSGISLSLGNFNVLQADLFRCILEVLGPKELGRLSGVCKFFMFLCNDNRIWENCVKKIYPDDYSSVAKKSRSPWKSVYCNCYREEKQVTRLQRMWSMLFKRKDANFLLMGLDAAGKTTLLTQMRIGKIMENNWTIGFTIETVKYKNIEFKCWDVGGPDKIRPLWRHYYVGIKAIIFVVDSADVERMEEASSELHKSLAEEELMGVPLLVFANKQDLPSAISVAEITDRFRLHSIRTRQWYIQASCATSGDGIYEGLDWLSCSI